MKDCCRIEKHFAMFLQQSGVPLLQAIDISVDTDTAVNLRRGAVLPEIPFLLRIPALRLVGREAPSSRHRINVDKPRRVHVAIATRWTSKFRVRRAER